MAKINFVHGNQLALLKTGQAFFPSLLAAIQQAQHEIYLETYIWAEDALSEQLSAALIAAAQRGVRVRLVIDWLGSDWQKSELITTRLQQAGVACRCFNPWFKRGIARTHRKLVAIDQKLAYIGGINIIDDYIADDGSGLALPFPRWDFAVSINGPIVSHIHNEIDAQWRKAGKLNLLSRFSLLRHLRQDAKLERGKLSSAALVIRDNFRNRRTLLKTLMQALGNAHHEVFLVTPYFAPGRRFRRAICTAAARGVKVKLLLGVGQFRLQDAVAHAYYARLLKYGVEIYEYQKTQLHAKLAIVDEDWTTIGSCNFDGLSLFVNHEANLVIKDKHFTALVRHEIEAGIADAKLVETSTYLQLPWYKKLAHNAAYVVYRSILRLLSYGHYG